jgi:uncharacterized protein YqjF (DUF2071 family)
MTRDLVRMGWHDALFVHWPVDAGTLADRLPDGVEPRTHDDSAWLGIVAFVMQSIRPRGVPRFAGLTFGEANLRTYVAGADGGEGIYFFNLDAADPLGVWVARTLYRLPYYRATMRIDRSPPREDATTLGRPPRSVEFVSNRIHPGAPDAHLDVGYGPLEEPWIAEPGSLEAFLVENYRFYLGSEDLGRRENSLDDSPGHEEGPDETRERIYAGDVVHEPWPLYRADLDLRSTNFLAVNGFETPDVDPIAHYSPGVEVTAGPIRRID